MSPSQQQPVGPSVSANLSRAAAGATAAGQGSPVVQSYLPGLPSRYRLDCVHSGIGSLQASPC